MAVLLELPEQILQAAGERATAQNSTEYPTEAAPPDEAAVALYTGLAICEDVLHFDIGIQPDSAC